MTNMNRLLGAASCALIIAFLTACSNGPVVYGGIQRIDPNAKTVTLYNGNTYTFPPSADISPYKVGDEVRIAYTTDTTVRPPKNNAKEISRYR
jgi:hypothetical protein